MRETAGSAAAPAAKCKMLRRGSFIASLSECRRRDASFRFDVGRPDHLGPLLGLFGDELAEVGRRAWKCGGAPLRKPRLHLGIGKGRVDLRVELRNDFGGRVLGRADAVPGTRLVARHKLSHGMSGSTSERVA